MINQTLKLLLSRHGWLGGGGGGASGPGEESAELSN